MTDNNLTDAEFADFNGIITETVNKLVACADKHNIDRNSLIQYFAAMFGTMAEISTFEFYHESEGGE